MSYAEIQASKNAKAREDYKALLPTLSPEVRAVLEVNGKNGTKWLKMDDSDEVLSNQTQDDAAVLPEASEGPRVYSDSLEDVLTESFGLTPSLAAAIVKWHHTKVEEEALRQVAVMLARLTGLLLSHSNLNLLAHALAYATHTAKANGLGSMRKACQRILKPNGKPVGVAALSKTACWLVGFLGLPPGEGMKSDDAVASYSAAQTKSHATRKNQKIARAIDRLN